MDGTLTEPLLDFAQIRSDMGIAAGLPILEALEQMNPAEREVANEVLCRHERAAAEQSTLNPGCRELLDFLAQHRLPTALITRNSLACTRIVLAAHGLSFDTLITREDPPYKPSPDPLWLALSRLGVSNRAAAVMVGDGEHDIAAAHAAGIASIWISHGVPRRFDIKPTYEFESLTQLHHALIAVR